MAATSEKAHASDKSEKKSKKDKKEKKESKKEKLNDDGVKKSKKSKDKKEKKEKAAKLADAVARELDTKALAKKKASLAENADSDSEVENENVATSEILAPFALPLADAKQHELLYDMVKRSAQLGMIARGVKECKKLIKKAPAKSQFPKGQFNTQLIVLIAGDVSPMEVIMALPLLCEEHNILYFFVKSRAQLGLAAATKRSTSIVALKTEAKKTATAEDVADHKKTEKKYLADFENLIRLAKEEFTKQVLPWIEGTHPAQLNFERKALAKAKGAKTAEFGRPVATD